MPLQGWADLIDLGRLTPHRQLSLKEPFHVLMVLWVTVGLALLGTGLVAALVWYLVPPLSPVAADLDQFTVAARDFYAEQPGKNAAFAAGCLAFPFFIGGAYLLAGRWVPGLSVRFLRSFFLWAALGTWVLFFWSLHPLLICDHPPLRAIPPSWLLFGNLLILHPFFSMEHFISAVLIGMCLVVAFRVPSARHFSSIFAALLILGALLAPSRMYAPSEIDDTAKFVAHLNAVLYPLTQSSNGHHVLVDFPSLYGGYVEILGPVLALFPRTTETLLLCFPVFSLVILFFFLLTARLTLRQPRLFLLTGLSLLGIVCVGDMRYFDHYYQYGVLRELFPALGLLVAALYLRGPSPWLYGLGSFLAAVAPVWNLDTGLVLWGSWAAMLAAKAAGERRFVEAVRQLLLQGLILGVGVGLFLLYLRAVSGHWPELGLITKFQSLFGHWGYFCLPLLFPDVWVAVLAVYGVGLGAALLVYFRGAATWRTHFIFMVSLMGVGLFSYFLGRSAEPNLMSAGYPVIFLIGLLADEAEASMAGGVVPQFARFFVWPGLLLSLWWAFLLLWTFPDICQRSWTVVGLWRHPAVTPYVSDAAFVQANTRPHEEVLILSNHNGFYYYLSDTVCPLSLAGPFNLYWETDIDRIVAALDAQRFSKLFIDRNFFIIDYYKPEVYDRINRAIDEHYRMSARSSDGHLRFYLPR